MGLIAHASHSNRKMKKRIDISKKNMEYKESCSTFKIFYFVIILISDFLSLLLPSRLFVAFFSFSSSFLSISGNVFLLSLSSFLNSLFFFLFLHSFFSSVFFRYVFFYFFLPIFIQWMFVFCLIVFYFYLFFFICLNCFFHSCSCLSQLNFGLSLHFILFFCLFINSFFFFFWYYFLSFFDLLSLPYFLHSIVSFATN